MVNNVNTIAVTLTNALSPLPNYLKLQNIIANSDYNMHIKSMSKLKEK